MRQFTRLTDAFSKKLANYGATVAVYFMYDNFARVAFGAPRDASDGSGVRGSVLSIEEIVGLLESPEVAA